MTSFQYLFQEALKQVLNPASLKFSWAHTVCQEPVLEDLRILLFSADHKDPIAKYDDTGMQKANLVLWSLQISPKEAIFPPKGNFCL